MQHQRRLVGRHGTVGDADGERRRGNKAPAAGGEPRGAAGLDRQRHRTLCQQCRRHRLDPRRIGETPAGRRLVEREAQAEIARGGDRGGAADERGRGARHRIGAAMAAEQRHRDRAVFGHRHHRRLGVLVAEQRRHGADEDAGGAEPDDRRAGGEERGDRRRGAVEEMIGRDAAAGRRVKARARQQPAQPPRQRQRARPQHQDGGALRQRIAHRSEPVWEMAWACDIVLCRPPSDLIRGEERGDAVAS